MKKMCFRNSHDIEIDDMTLDPVLTRDEQTPFVHYYRAEAGRIAVYKQRMDATVYWLVSVSLFLWSAAVQGWFPHAVSCAMSFGVMLVFQVMDTNRYRSYDKIRTRCELMERGMYACMFDADACDRTWKAKLLRSWLGGGTMTFGCALYLRFRNAFVYIYAFHVCFYVVLFLHTYN